jgi:Matrixin
MNIIGRLRSDQVLAINWRFLILGLLSTGLVSSAHAQSTPSALTQRVEWKTIPSIVLISTEDDSRMTALREAIDFWNDEFSALGSPFRLGTIVHSLRTISAADLQALRARSSTRPLPIALITTMREANADVVVVFPDDGDFNPFTSRWTHIQKVLVAIPSFRKYPFTLPNAARHLPGIARNILAHEFGHVIGLDHNDDKSALMCGGTGCPFVPSKGQFLPLTSAEKAKLLEMYPPSWEPKPSRRWKADPPTRISG